MDFILLPTSSASTLERHYERALSSAVELYIVSAYLTEWEAPKTLNKNCRTFRFIIGRDFGITRKEACRAVMSWLPARLKNRFMVAEQIDGFHPKAMFWRDESGGLHGLVGSSNLTRAAFSSNHEANVYVLLNTKQFEQVREWMRSIEPSCVSVSEDWLERYREAPNRGSGRPGAKNSTTEFIESLRIPHPAGATAQVRERRAQLASYRQYQDGLMELFRDCAVGTVSSAQFYKDLPKHWSWGLGDRLQGAGWERQGKASDFQKLSQAFLRIVDASDAERDDIVAEEIDWLHKEEVKSRAAFLSEMLCLRFPNLYPVKNKPVEVFLSAIKFRGPKGTSEGAYYVDLAQRLRMSLQTNPKHPAKNIAELDAVIWLAYGKKHD
jgi:hypothetical protein